MTASPSYAAPAAVILDGPVARGATTTTLTVVPNPAGLLSAVTLTATVAVTPPASGTPTGLVRFRANGSVIGAVNVAASGIATLTTSLVIPGSVDLTANYVGDNSFAPSTSAIVPHQTAAAGASTLTVIATSPSPSVSGAAVTVLGIVLPLGGGTPTGSVQFFDGATSIGTAAVTSFSGLQVAFVTMTPASPGVRTLTARYSGDATFAGSVSPPGLHTVYSGAAPSATTTTLVSAPASSLVGQSVKLTATVTRAAGGIPTGTVDFYAYGTLLGSQALATVGGTAQAALTVTSLPKGLAPIAAAYRGNATSAASATGLPVFQCVDCAATNATPLAKAGPVQAVAPGAVVQLDGSASSDLEGAPLTYTWTNITTAPFQPATLSNPTSARPTFVAGPGETVYAFDLVVSDGALSSPPDRVYIIGTTTFVNGRPIAQAGPDQFVEAGQGITLNGSGSVDPDGQPLALTYQWVLRTKPVGSAAELSSTTSPAPTFFLDLEGRYEFELVVFDGATASVPDRVVIATNHPPIARAGDDQERAVGSTAHLSGAGSTDLDGQRLTYAWTLLSSPIGSTAALSNPSAVRPTLPIDVAGNYVVRLIVSDGTDASDPDTITISTGDLPPAADPGPAQHDPGATATPGPLGEDGIPVATVAIGQTVRLDGTGSYDPNFQFLSSLGYQWTLVLRPAGSAATLTGPTTARPTFVADVAGDYVARLVVTSGTLSSIPRDIRISTGNSRPMANAGRPRTVAPGATVSLDGTGSTDVNGNPLSYQWSFLTAPAGSTATLSGDTSPRPTFIADVAGTYVAQVVVGDGVFFDAATVLITTANVAPIGRAGADQAVPAPSSVTLDGTTSSDENFDPLLYRWILARRPAGSTAALTGGTTAAPSFSVDVAGDYVAQLRVSDGERFAPIDTVLVTTANARPLANAGDDQNAGVNGMVSLDGTGSSDANGDPLTYQWAILYRPAGSAATLSNPAAAEPSFVADVAGTYVVQLITADATLRSAPDTVTITTVGAPTAVAVVPATAYTGAAVPLDGSASTDPQQLPLTYLWSFGSRPAGSVASIANPLAAITSFTPDLAGAYVVCLVVSNGAVASAPDCEPVMVANAPALTLSPGVVNLAFNESATMTVTLNQPAGPSGVDVSLEAAGTATVTVPPSVSIGAGLTFTTFTVTAGAVPGPATVAATAAGYVGDLAHVNVSTTGITITLGSGLVLAPQQIRDLSVTLSEPAPAGGVLVTLTSSSPGIATVTPSVFIPAGADVPTGNPQVTGVTYGMTEISATALGVAGDSEVVAVARSISLTPSTLSIVIGGIGTLLLQASSPAPAGGLSFNVNVSPGGVITAPATTTIPPNELTATIPVSGAGLGTAAVTITPTDPADTSSASASVIVSAAQPINLQAVSVGKDLMAQTSGSLGAPAPAGNLSVTIVSADPSKVLLSSSLLNAGTASISVTVAAGSTQLPPFFVHGLADTGAVLLTASAAGLPDAQSSVTLTPSGFRLNGGNFVTGVFSPNTLVAIQSVRLDPGTHQPIEPQALRIGASAAITLTSSNPAVGTILNPPLLQGPLGQALAAFDPIASGTTRITLGVPAGFTASAAQTEITATVAAPLTFSAPSLTIGRDLQVPASIALGSPAPAGNLPVVITSADPSKVLLSKTVHGVASASISLTVPAGSSTTTTFFVQSLADSGTVAVSAAAANYDPAALAVNLAPSGIVFVTQSFTTETTSANTTLTLASAWLEPGSLEYVPGASCNRCQGIRSGHAPFDVTVSSSDNAVGSVPNVATFTSGNSTATTEFDPHVAGSVTLTIVTPAGFTTPADHTQIVASIAPPSATLSAANITVGKNLQAGNGVSLGEPAPAGNLLVTIQSVDPSRVRLSLTPTSPAMDTITLFVPAGQSTSPGFFVQALDDTGQVTLNLDAPGYIAGSADVTLRPSGFVFQSGSFSTSVLSGDTAVAIQSVWLDAGTLTYVPDASCSRCQVLRSGVSADVDVTSTPSAVGTITISPVAIAAGTGGGSTAFHPLSGGTATLAVLAPAGFSTPANFREITATVGNPSLSMSDTTVGKDLETALAVTLGAPAEAGGTTVTVVSADPASVLLSTSPTLAGTSSLTLNVPGGQSQTPVFYAQALVGVGAAQLSATASGFNPATSAVSFRPSGFVFVSGGFTTGALSANTTVTLRSVWLDPVSLNWGSDPFCTRCQPLRGGISPVGVTVISSDPSVGTITGPAIFAAGAATADTAFDPASNGVSTLTIQAPAGFSAASDFNSIVATVQPSVQLSGATIGRDLETVVSGGLTVAAPAGNLVVTLQSSDPSRLLLSASPTAAGQASITVLVTAGQGGFSYYAQALTATGSADVLATAPGYSDGHATVTFAPSGFVLDAGDFSVSPSAPNVPLTIRSVRLDPDFLNYIVDGLCSSCQPLRPGVSAVITVTSSDPSVGSIVGTAAFSAGVSNAQVQFDPQTVGVTTVALGVPPPSPFSTPSNFQSIVVTVELPPPSLNIGSVTVGKNLQAPSSGSLGAAAPAGNLDVTITSADPDKVLLSASPTAVGASSITLVVSADSTTIPAFYVQALSDTGVVQLTASAPGYLTGHSNVTLWPAGFVLVTGSFSTTTLAAPTQVDVRSVRIDPLFHNYAPDTFCTSCQAVRAGFTADVPVVSANTAIGTITVSPLSFAGGDGLKSTAFDPATAGVVAISLTAPAGFETPSNFQSINATVTGPPITLASASVGKDLQTATGGSLGAAAPAGGLSVTITSSDPGRLRLAASPTDVGTPSIVVMVPAGETSLPTFYLQSLDGSGSVDITATAPAYASGTTAIALVPSGFVILSGNFSTSTLADPVTLTVYSVALSPALAYASQQPLRPGATAQVVVTASDVVGTGVGTIVGSPVTFGANEGSKTVAFDPATAGQSLVAVIPPAGFSTPTNFRTLTAIVAAPPMFVGGVSIGKELQVPIGGSLGAVSPGSVSFTFTSTDPSKVRLAATPTAPGAASVVVTAAGPASFIPTVYVHGLADTGTVTLNVTSPVYAPTTADVVLTPSGFIISSPVATLTTQGNAANSEIQISSVRLAPGTLISQGPQPLRPSASAVIAVTSSIPAVGTITVSPVVFNANEGLKSTFFDPQPVATDGTTTVSITTPPGFSTPSHSQQIQATVTAVVVDHNATSNYTQWAAGSTAAPYLANFDSFATGTILTGLEYSANGLTIVQRDGHPMRIASPGDGSFLQPGNLNSQPRGLTSSGVPAFYDGSKSENYDFVFTHSVLSAGLWIGNLNPGFPAVVVQFLDSTGSVIQSYDALANDANLVQGPGGDVFNNRVFVGLNATVPIARIRVFNGINDNDGVVFDDVVFSRAATTIIDFEDQPDSLPNGPFPASYRGITWSNFLQYAPYPGPYLPGGVNAIFGAVDGARFFFPEQVFTGADFSRSPGNPGAIFFELYRQGSLVWTSAQLAGTGPQLTFLPSGYTGPVDEVRVRSLGSSMTGAGGAWVMDNVSFIKTTAAGSLRLTPTSSSRAVGSTDPMTVSIADPLSFDLAVSLASSAPAVASVPPSVVIPAGATSAVFTLTGASSGGSLITAASPDASPAKATVAIGTNLVEWISNSSGNWTLGANWSGGVQPASGDVVVIDRPASNIVVTVDTTTAGLRSLYATEFVNIAGTLQVQNTSALDGGFSLSGLLQGTGRVFARGSSSWSAGSLTLSGGLDIEAGQTLTFASGNEKEVSFSALRNHGTIEWNGGILRFNNGGSALNDAGALWKVNGDLQMASNSNGQSPFVNAGTIRKTAGSGFLTIGGGAIQLTNGPTGTIDLRSGSLQNAGDPLLNSGHFSLAAGTTFLLNAVTLQAGSTYSGEGMLVANGTTTVNAPLTIPVATTVTSVINGPGKWTTAAPFTWQSGTVAMTGGLDVGPGQTLTFTSGNEKEVSFSALRNHGTIEWNGGILRFNNGSSGLNDTAALWKVNGDLQMASNSNGQSLFNNLGIMRKTTGAGFWTIGGGAIQLTNGATGTIDLQAGSFQNAGDSLVNNGHVSVAAGTTFLLNAVTLQTGSTYSGDGTLVANGTTTVNGNLTIPVATTVTSVINGPGKWTTAAPFTWQSGTVAMTGGLDVGSGQTLTFTSGNEKEVSFSALRNHGTIEWNGGILRFNNGSSGLNDTAALWNVNGDLQMASNANGFSPFNNMGIIRKTTGAGPFTIGGGTVQFFNLATGTIEVQSGTLVNASEIPLTNSGNISLTGGTFSLNNVVLQAGSTFSGGGTLIANGNTIVNAPLTISLPTEVTGTITGTGRWTTAAPFTFTSGTITLTGGIDVGEGQTLTFASANEKELSFSSLRNHGTVEWNGGVIRINNGSSGLNDTTGLFKVNGDFQLVSNSNGNSNFTNAGILRKTTGAGTFILGGTVALTNGPTGTIDIQSGTFVNGASTALSTSGLLSLAAGTTMSLNNVTLQTGSTFSGNGTLQANGTTSVNGLLTVPLATELTGTLNGSGRWTTGAPFTWTSGVISVAGGLDNEAGQTLTIATNNEHVVDTSTLRNRGTVDWTGGVVRINNGSVLNNVAGATWQVGADQQVVSNGNGIARFQNFGTLKFTGAARQLFLGGGGMEFSNTGTLEMRIGGAAVGQYDRINDSSNIVLGGTLDVKLINGFVPAVPDQFGVILYPSRTGTFGTINGNGHTYAACYGATTFTLGDPANPSFCGGS